MRITNDHLKIFAMNVMAFFSMHGLCLMRAILSPYRIYTSKLCIEYTQICLFFLFFYYSKASKTTRYFDDYFISQMSIVHGF